ncbi:lipid kinase, YegS/Rv2252/BmrU family [Tenacibaculum sp. MAR_2009_124]|uniref:diacylglycerol/lipid kinase family protein n=1 Tax=Tenacibaculum sp. MAR_2009_124 TaxID=1250059 RepID=UPI000899EAB7|nr:diacylglycerol kinase family protein [Tenacibaculum sp. MAR_2009_124]SEC42886.1 lipid kinase, YegS/Rv2252/BmrU family [Tenacibaculum sp. MAR_2009_124]
MANKWYVIANPNAGNKKLKSLKTKIKYQFEHYNIKYTFKITTHHKHEIELVHIAVKQGYTHFVSVGGDGTLHYIVNGIMTQNIISSHKIVVGVIPLGTGNDWVKTYNISKNIQKAVELLKKLNTTHQDIGYLELKNTSRYFNNVAGIGYDGYVVNKLNRLKLLGSIAYLLSGISGMLCYKKNNYDIVINNETLKEKCLMVLFGICQYSGGGMKLTNYTATSKGLLDITIAKNLNLYDLIKNIKKLYNGSIIHHVKVKTYKTTALLITPKSTEINSYIEADGEIVGTGEVKVSIHKNAIQFVINESS